jgi:hypothetical protein
MEAGLEANMEADRDTCDSSTFHVVLATSVQLDVHAGRQHDIQCSTE